MAETHAHNNDGSPESVALKLLYTIAFVEGKALWSGATSTEKPDRKWVLETYAECLRTVKGETA